MSDTHPLLSQLLHPTLNDALAILGESPIPVKVIEIDPEGAAFTFCTLLAIKFSIDHICDVLPEIMPKVTFMICDFEPSDRMRLEIAVSEVH